MLALGVVNIMRNMAQIISKYFSTWMRKFLVTEGPLRKPKLIERLDGYVTEVSEWKTYKKAKEAMVKLGDGTMVGVFIPPPVMVHKGDHINISVYALGDSSRFYAYRKHLTNA